MCQGLRQMGIAVNCPPLTRVTPKLQRRVPSSGENSPFDKCGFGFGFEKRRKVYAERKEKKHTHAIIMLKQMFVSLLFTQRTIQSTMRKKRAKNTIDLGGREKKSQKESQPAKPLSQLSDFTDDEVLCARNL